MTEIGTVIDGKYEILREIGRGGMSIVYLAMDTHLNKQWAVKEIRKKVMARMMKWLLTVCLQKQT